MNGLGKNLLLAFSATILALVVAEAVLRIFIGAPARGNITPVPPDIVAPSKIPGVPYVLRPGSRAVHRFPDDPRGYFDPGATLTYRINSLGFRGGETSRRKPARVFRILGVGDSFTFGSGVRADDTFLADLERRLAAVGTSRTFEVLNLGVMGFNTVHEVALLRDVGVGYEPDIVVICFFLNDAEGGGTHSVFNVSGERDGVGSLVRHSFLLDRIAFRLERRRQLSELVESYHRGFEPAEPRWVAAQRALEEAAALAERERFQLALAIFPVLWDLSDGYPFLRIHETVTKFARSSGIPVLDLLPAFAGHRGPELWVHPTNQHPNETAHAIAGQALFQFLSIQGMLPPDGPGPYDEQVDEPPPA